MTKLAKLRHLLHGRLDNIPDLTGAQTSKARSSSISTPTAAVLTGITLPAAGSTGNITRHQLPLQDKMRCTDAAKHQQRERHAKRGHRAHNNATITDHSNPAVAYHKHHQTLCRSQEKAQQKQQAICQKIQAVCCTIR